MFLISRSILSYLSIITDIIITIFWRYRLSSALNYILMYDLSTKFNEKKFLKSSLQWCRFFIIVSLIWWCIIGYVNSLTIKNHPVMSVFSHTLLYGGSSMQILKFSVLIFLLYRRFDHLCSIIIRKVISKSVNSISLENVWRMHYNLSMAVEKINDIWSYQLLIWIFSLSLNTASRFYVIFNPQEKNKFVLIRDGMCAIGFLMNLTILIASCHLLSQRNIGTQSYFLAKKIRLTAAGGFVYMELPLLFSGFMIDDEFQCQPDYFDYFLLFTNWNESYTTSYVNLTTHKNISKNKIQSSLTLLNTSNYKDKYTTIIAHTSDCRSNFIYILRESSDTDDFTKVVDLIHYDNNKYEKINRTFHTFDNATSIAYDWMNNNLYWAEKIDDLYSIKRRGPHIENTESINIPDSEKLFVGKLNIYSKRGMIFWIGTKDIWYAHTTSNSMANLFIETKSNNDLITDLTIDTSLDRLCWFSYNQIAAISNIYCTSIINWLLSNTFKTITIAKNLKDAQGLAVFNNVFYWIASNHSNFKSIYSKIGHKNPVEFKMEIHGQELAIVLSHCPVYDPNQSDNHLLYFTESELFEFSQNKTDISKLKIEGIKNENHNIAFSSNCANKNIYILQKSKKNGIKRILNVITYAGHTFKLIDQITDTFDYAESIAYDWITENIYWVELRNQRYGIKATGPHYRYSEYVALPEEQPPIKHIYIHPRIKMIFWKASNKIWYVSIDEKTDDERRIFYEGPETKNMSDMAVDLALDRLCWFSRQSEKLDANNHTFNSTTLYCVNIDGPRNIIVIDENLNDARNLVVYNDTYYWIAKIDEKLKSFFFKNGKNESIKIMSNLTHYGKESIFFTSNCPLPQTSNAAKKISKFCLKNLDCRHNEYCDSSICKCHLDFEADEHGTCKLKKQYQLYVTRNKFYIMPSDFSNNKSPLEVQIEHSNVTNFISQDSAEYMNVAAANDCKNKTIYVLREYAHKSVPKKILDVMRYDDDNNKFQIINQTVDVFDNALLIVFDWLTENLYWSEETVISDELQYSIKVVGPKYSQPKHILSINGFLSFVNLHIHPVHRKIFWSSFNGLWLYSITKNTTSVFYQGPETQNIVDSAIDIHHDKLCWLSRQMIPSALYTICESTSNPLSNNCVNDSDCGSNTYCNSHVCSCKQGFTIDDEFQCQPDYFDYFLLFTNWNESYTTSYVNLTTHKNISKNKIQSPLTLLNTSNYNDKYTTIIAHTTDCRSNFIYILRESSDMDDFTKVVDLIHYDNNKYEKITRVFDTFDNATSIAYDWTTNNLYWAEKINDLYSIKRRGPHIENIESINIPDSEKLFVGKLNIYSKRGIIFWIGTKDIWYAHTTSNSMANLFVETKSNNDLIIDLTIDSALDRLCWISNNQITKISNLYCTEINNWQPSSTLKIITIAKNLNDAHGLAVFNNVFYWIASNSSNHESIYLKNRNKNTVSIKLKVHGYELAIVPSHCPISDSKYNNDNLLHLTDGELFELAQDKTDMLKLKIQGLTNKNHNIEFSSNCANKIIYILQKSKKNDDKRILNVITYAGHTFKLIDQITDTFNYAESIAYDWITENIYWVELRNQRYAIKVTGPHYMFSKYVVFPDEQLSVKKIYIHPRFKMIFWKASNKIWYVSIDEKIDDERRIFYEGPETKNMSDMAVDLALDRLCWFSRQSEKLDANNHTFNSTTLYCVTIDGPRNIIVIDENLNDARNLVVYNDTYYWIAKIDEKFKTIFFKNGNEETVKLELKNNINYGKELIFFFPSCPSSQISDFCLKNSDCRRNEYCDSSVCKCPPNYETDENNNCILKNEFNFFLYVTTNKFYSLPLLNFSTNQNSSEVTFKNSINSNFISHDDDKYFNIALTSDCTNGNIYLLRENVYKSVPKKILSVMHFNDNSFEIINQTVNIFDNATSIAFDWMTECLYWSEKIQHYNETNYFIKVIGPNYKKPKFIITSDQISSIVKIHIHPKRSEIFWTGFDDIWSSSTSINSTAYLFLKNKETKNILDSIIDFDNDRFCWLSYKIIKYPDALYSVYCAPFNVPRPIDFEDVAIITQINKSIQNIAVFNNSYYWTILDDKNSVSVNSTNNQRKNIFVNKNDQGVLLTIYPQRCPASDALNFSKVNLSDSAEISSAEMPENIEEEIITDNNNDDVDDPEKDEQEEATEKTSSNIDKIIHKVGEIALKVLSHPDIKKLIKSGVDIASQYIPPPIGPLLALVTDEFFDSVLPTLNPTNDKPPSNGIDENKNKNLDEMETYMDKQADKIISEITHVVDAHNMFKKFRLDRKKIDSYYNLYYKNYLHKNIRPSESIMNELTSETSEFRKILSEFTRNFITTQDDMIAEAYIEKNIFENIIDEYKIRVNNKIDCGLRTRQSLIYKIFISTTTSVANGYALVVAAYMKNYSDKIHKQGYDERVMGFAIDAINEYKYFLYEISKHAKTAMEKGSTQIRPCDPGLNHVRNETWERFDRIIQMYIGTTCNYSARNYLKINYRGKTYTFKKDKCKSFFLDNENDLRATAYYNEKNHERLVNYVEIKHPNKKISSTIKIKYFGNSSRGDEHSMKIEQTGVDCNSCSDNNHQCSRSAPVVCPITPTQNKFQYISLQSVEASENCFIIGVRWRMIKKILYLQIKEGKYENNKIIKDSVKWVPIVQDRSMTSTVKIGTKTIFSLEDAVLPIGYGLKGKKLFYLALTFVNNETIGLKIWGIPLIPGDNNTEEIEITKLSNDGEKIEMNEPDQSEYSPENFLISEPGQQIQLQQTDEIKDAAQTTVPYLDIQDVESNPSQPLAGVGIYYKGNHGFGGFIGIRIFVIDMSDKLNLDKLQDGFSKLDLIFDQLKNNKTLIDYINSIEEKISDVTALSDE
ncbi:hypothetical protein HCN44_003148 [Aphidius gifuensis]|uniref:EGF-like domain-containing protein n=1 Tax=Aphidius gifuensis TaxID=684658 RepID=A0A834XI76_APHGI|nr:hypothetical protein HCN44_003148 [Aphidius gifuensis]